MTLEIPYTTTLAAARATVLAVKSLLEGDLKVKTLQEYHETNSLIKGFRE